MIVAIMNRSLLLNFLLMRYSIISNCSGRHISSFKIAWKRVQLNYFESFPWIFISLQCIPDISLAWASTKNVRLRMVVVIDGRSSVGTHNPCALRRRVIDNEFTPSWCMHWWSGAKRAVLIRSTEELWNKNRIDVMLRIDEAASLLDRWCGMVDVYN